MKAYELLADKRAWNRDGHMSRENGRFKQALGWPPVSYCILGAMSEVYKYGEAYDQVSRKIYKKLCKLYPAQSIINWNDHKATHAEVIALLKAADV